MCSQHRDDVLLASRRSSAACHHGAKALPARQQEGLALEKDWRVYLCPGKGWQGVHCSGVGRTPRQKSPASPGGRRMRKVTGGLQRSPPSPKGKGVAELRCRLYASPA